jgi:uncharacterized protein (DUF1499 family)
MTYQTIPAEKSWRSPTRLPSLAFFLAVVAALMLAAGPVGWRLGWWHYRFAFFSLMPWSGYLALAAVGIAAFALVFSRQSMGWGGVVLSLCVLAMGAVLVYVPWQWDQLRKTVPSIHDITTDTENPPALVTVLAARKAEEGSTEVYGGPEVAKQQKAAYPDIAPVMFSLPPAQAFERALATAKAMPGWTIVTSDPQQGRIEATQSSRFFGFTDDIVIRVAADGAGSRVDMRSVSRQGRSDFGVNAERVRAYMAALKGGFS